MLHVHIKKIDMLDLRTVANACGGGGGGGGGGEASNNLAIIV